MKALYATFRDVDSAIDGARRLRAAGYPVLDALTPYPVEPLTELVGGHAAPGLRGPMAVAGFGSAAAFFALETWSAVWAYPFNEGGRPLFSWPVFLLSPFEVGVLLAAVAGFGAFLLRTGLPRFNHPAFSVPGVERTSQDRFMLVVDPLDTARLPAAYVHLANAGALAVTEADA